jgi:hypothetical protein
LVLFFLFQKTVGKTPMSVSNPQDVPEYELNPLHLEFRRNEELSKVLLHNIPFFAESVALILVGL